MNDLTNPAYASSLLKKHGTSADKRFGQNFLIDGNYRDKILQAADLREDEVAVEVGPGIGALTQKMARMSAWVAAIEIDRRLIPILEESLQEEKNLSLINEDILKLSLSDIVGRLPESVRDKRLKIVANLPYYITTPVITRFLLDPVAASRLVFMIQLEVAQRICAPPGGKEYGSLSVFCQYFCHASIYTKVPATVFLPRPEVTSAVVILERKDKTSLTPAEEEVFFKIVRTAFAQRRKTIANSLKADSFFTDGSMLPIEEALRKAGIDTKRRAETLGVEEYKILCKTFLG